MIMLTLGIILVSLLGFLSINYISARFSWTEQLGLAFPVGIGLQTIFMLVSNLFGFALSAMGVLSSCLLGCGILGGLLYLRRRKWLSEYHFPEFDFSGSNFVWMLFMVLIVYFEYMNFVKCMYFPTFDRDSLVGFDTIGYVAAREHTFRHLSLFNPQYMPQINDAGSYITYAPMVQLSYAFVYLLGAESSKIIPALMYLSLLVAFYGSMKRVVGKTAAATATFFMMITPEMISFSSLSATNIIHAVTASLGVIYVAIYFKQREKRDLYLGSLLLGLNIWTRTDGVVFILAALFVVFIDACKGKRWKKLLPLCASFAPALLWVLFMKMYHFHAESIAITHPFWDSEKAGLIWKYIKALVTNVQYYGWSFYAFVGSLLLNVWFLLKKRDNLALLTMIVTALALYMVALYQIDYKWDTIHNVLSYSAKRFLFCFMPLVWFFIVSNHWMASLFGRMERFLK